MRLPLLALALLLIAPHAAAHGAPVVLEVEEHLIADEASDISYLWDGFDITDVYVREAHFKAGAADGLIFRILASGIPLLANEYVLEISSDLTGPITLTSPDGLAWESSHLITEQLATTDPSTQAIDVNLQVFVPMSLDQTLGPVTATSKADGQTVDEAPGGMFIQGIPYTAEGEGTRLLDELILDGPDGYTESTATYADGILTVAVSNLIRATGQHVFALSDIEPTTADYSIDGATTSGFAASIEPGQDVTFTYKIDAGEPFRVRIQSDLGGQETFWMTPAGDVVTEPDAIPAPSTEEAPLQEESPGIGFVVLALALIGAAWRRQS